MLRAAPFARIFALASLIALGSGACFGGGPRLLTPEDAGTASPVDFGDASDDVFVKSDVDLGDPFAILGLTPGHGPWKGGTRTVIRGRGFTSKMEITVGGRAVDASAIVASDPTRVAIVTPEGVPGAANVEVKNVGTAAKRILEGGFIYDALVVTPESGAQTGGTRVRIEGSGTSFAAGATHVFFGANECTDVAIKSPTTLDCTTPAGSLGPVEVVAKTEGADDLSARDAFTYTDLFDPARGGFTGGVLNGSIRVNALDAATGLPLPGARVVAGETLATGVVGVTAANGSATLAIPTTATKMSVTVAAKCHQPMTFIDVPVDTVTAYLSPVMDLSCASLDDPPSTGSHGFRNGGVVVGELVWDGGVEFKRSGWTNIPKPLPSHPNERMAAYVFLASPSPQSSFSLPPATQATTIDSPGINGYGYSIVAAPGNVTVYAIAGLEDRSAVPPRFTPYAMGVARGVAVSPNTQTTGVDIPMSSIIDHQLQLTAPPPPIGPRGPDRLVASYAVSIGANAYAIMPSAQQIHLLPFPGDITFAPVPSLDGSLAGEAYVVGATAVSTPSQTAPASIISRVRVTDANSPVALGGFLPVPTMVQPATGTFSGTHVEVTAGGTWDLLEVVVSSGGGMSSWTMVAPAGRSSFDVPDLSTLPDDVGLKHGPIETTVYVARFATGSSYPELKSTDLAPNKWSAYAWDRLQGNY